MHIAEDKIFLKQKGKKCSELAGMSNGKEKNKDCLR
jgi:hypothetical protein